MSKADGVFIYIGTYASEGDARADYDVVHDNQCLGTGLLRLPGLGFPTLATIHHPVQVDRALELAQNELAFRRDVYTYDALAWVLFQSGRKPEAREAMQKALAQTRLAIPGGVEARIAATPLRKAGTGAEVGAAASFLLSDRASHLSGVILPVDGGFVT